MSCFNPLVMLSTFTIELILFVFLLVKTSKKDTKTLLALSMLLLLAAFQGSEYVLCKTTGNDEMWAQIGFVIITLLPPLGIHLVSAISGVKSLWSKVLIPLAYINGFVWSAIFGLGIQSFDDFGCADNYAIFNLSDNYAGHYQAYYYGWLFAGLFLASWLAKKAKKKDERSRLSWLMIGYLSFIIPTIVFQYAKPHISDAVPSVMCGFALLFAFILVFKIIKPGKQKKRKKRSRK